MTPKEKAEELILKFKEVPMGYGVNEVMWSIPSDVARLLALRCVDEILKNKEIIDGMRVINDQYWSEVKQEIKLL
jgi:hypothetical protein